MVGVTGASRDLRRWPAEFISGLYRCAILVVLASAVPLVAAGVAFGGVRYALSWSAHLSAPWSVRVLAAVGEYALGFMWTAIVVSTVFAAAGQTLCEAARVCARLWTGLRLEASYRSAPEVTQMATGFWWSGHEYHRTEAEARRKAQEGTRSRDPQLRSRNWRRCART